MNEEKKQIKEIKVLETAFELYLRKKIENVTMEEIAETAGIGVATVYRNYQTKLKLAAKVCAYKWKLYLNAAMGNRTPEYVANIDAIDRLDFTYDLYIDLYRNHKGLLLVNDNFNHFYHANKKNENLPEYVDAFEMLTARFHNMYERAKIDGTMRTDIPEDELLRVLFHTMMGTCNHYLGGFSWGASESQDYTKELIMLKGILMDYARTK